MNKHFDFFLLIRVVNVNSLFDVFWVAVYECPRLLSVVIIVCMGAIRWVTLGTRPHHFFRL